MTKFTDAWHKADEREAEQTLKRKPLTICEELTRYKDDDPMRLINPSGPKAKAIIEVLVEAAKRLSFAAQTSGGTAGRDDELVAAIEQTKVALEAAGVKP